MSAAARAQCLRIHPVTPQRHLIRQAAQIIRAGGLAVLPTDSRYALVCQLHDKAAIERLRRVRGLDDKHPLTLMCRSLSDLAAFARVDNRQYRLIKAATPGAFVFLLEATREVPRRLAHASRGTIGLRVPDHPIPLALMAELDGPLLSATLRLSGDAAQPDETETIRARLEKQLELVIDGGPAPAESTTVIDLTGEAPVLIREGRGDLARIGL